MNECSLVGLMSDVGLKVHEEPREAARASVGCDDDVTRDMLTDEKCLSDPGGPTGTHTGCLLPSPRELIPTKPHQGTWKVWQLFSLSSVFKSERTVTNPGLS